MHALLSRQQQPKDNTRIPLVLTYHPALQEKAGESLRNLRQFENILCVDQGHRAVFRNKIFMFQKG